MSEGFYLGGPPTSDQIKELKLDNWETRKVEYKIGLNSIDGVKFSEWRTGTINQYTNSNKDYDYITIEEEPSYKFLKIGYQKPSAHFPEGIFVNGSNFLIVREININV